jgi:hypothetical protein
MAFVALKKIKIASLKNFSSPLTCRQMAHVKKSKIKI